ncbi:NAD+ diphosphatase [Parabacteroides sp. PF5-5]|uniref:NUDIX domain-containing protein n=1 Tax=unclassified Parabacteroides TaxID=2649774 RepID=UPI002473BDC4|nr:MULTISPECIES: NUDIX domain-containing protein [unclassified Parabacteroides]MDH6305258.1 NAD+ diphosphatase [Parabacteroides sp. PH5-39]MDH6316611.1 NAD+ diphosphatase [Parabacteroides sp. PF5-13]MDH6320209.1 NAD+ diphosphatase [Parabacteroides sp. PH5-13]MDH6323848.1 NAD+ diphosphatase [Parabacteroides sp. PH5-8]MDH6327886.1 NAD+ diphosphatase [Parabacteroides sp. PH5-41]
MTLHPLHQFVYCPACGAKAFEARNEKAKQCTVCGFTYYFNPSASVACFIKNAKGELLLVRRAKDPAKDTLDLPGGFADMYESAEEVARREIQEETGLTISSCRYLFSIPNVYPYMGFNVHTLDLFFECYTDSFDNAKANDDAASIIILPPSKLNPEDFGLQSIKKAIERYLGK